MEPYEILREDEQGADGDATNDVQNLSKNGVDTLPHLHHGKLESGEIILLPRVTDEYVSNEQHAIRKKTNNESTPDPINKFEDRHSSDDGDGHNQTNQETLNGNFDLEVKEETSFHFVSQSAVKFGFGTSSSDTYPPNQKNDDPLFHDGNCFLEESLLNKPGEDTITAQNPKSPLLELENKAFTLEKETFTLEKIGFINSKGRSDGSSTSSDQFIGKDNLSVVKKGQSVKEQDKVPLLLSSPAKTDASSEEESTLMSTSVELDSMRSPGVVSDGEGEDQGVCSKYSQLSEDGSSPSLNLKTDIDNSDLSKVENRVVFEHSLELGVAFSEFVDVDHFKASLGSRNPHTGK